VTELDGTCANDQEPGCWLFFLGSEKEMGARVTIDNHRGKTLFGG
jgi:hypothetical protein